VGVARGSAALLGTRASTCPGQLNPAEPDRGTCTTGTIRYTTRWNDLTNRPSADHDWIDEGQARDRFERNEFIDVVESSTIGSDGLVYPRWVMGIAGLRGVAGGARLEFHDGQGSIWRAVDYQIVQGRLFRSNVADFAYSTDRQRWEMSEATAGVEVTVDPDGTGTGRPERGEQGAAIREFSRLLPDDRDLRDPGLRTVRARSTGSGRAARLTRLGWTDDFRRVDPSELA
jgi:hypothetical protein